MLAFIILECLCHSLKPINVVREVLLYGLWLSVRPSVSHHLAHLLVQDLVAGGVEVEACKSGGECQRKI